MNIFKRKKKNDSDRNIRDLLRENLNLVSLDMFYLDDPINKLSDEERKMYLKFFFDLYNSKELIQRIKYHINIQAYKTLGNAQNGVQDVSGSMNINGMAFIMEDIERLAKQHIKESTQPPEQPLDPFSIIPSVDRI